MAQAAQAAQAPQAAEGETGAEHEAAIDPREVLEAAAAYARENPHTAIAGAFAVGFLLGGGLTPRLLVSAALFAGRRYLAESARGALQEAVEKQIDAVTAG